MKNLFTCLVLVLLCSYKTFSIPKLNSLPGATATIFLDFDGQTVVTSFWNSGAPIFCAPSGMTDVQVIETFNRVAEDYRPFQLNITTDSTLFLAAPLTMRARVIITPTNSWSPGAYGVSYVGSFSYGEDIPSFVFCNLLGPNNPKWVAECCAHESGHAVGLTHQSKYGADCTTPTDPYNHGTGTGEISWAPIMGWSLNNNMTNWNNGPTPYGCNNIQDNLSIIATTNGFGYRADDYGETLDGSTYTLTTPNFSVNGIIATNNDKDAFRFSLATNSTFHISAVPYNLGTGNSGADLDIKLELFNSSGTLIRTYDPPEIMDVNVDTVLNAGTYYIKIDGTGNVNIGEYGSLGSYTITGTGGALPIHDVALVGTVDKSRHNLNWNIIADEPIKSIAVESSNDGISFSTLTTVAANANKFSYTNYQSNTVYYRLKVTSVLDQTVYSNIITLKSAGTADKPFIVSTLVHNEITVSAYAKYDYRLSDMNGRVINKGSGLKGVNKVNVYNLPNGMYIIQLYSNNEQQTERIIRQ